MQREFVPSRPVGILAKFVQHQAIPHGILFGDLGCDRENRVRRLKGTSRQGRDEVSFLSTGDRLRHPSEVQSPNSVDLGPPYVA